jgi:hypothetical protein
MGYCGAMGQKSSIRKETVSGKRRGGEHNAWSGCCILGAGIAANRSPLCLTKGEARNSLARALGLNLTIAAIVLWNARPRSCRPSRPHIASMATTSSHPNPSSRVSGATKPCAPPSSMPLSVRFGTDSARTTFTKESLHLPIQISTHCDLQSLDPCRQSPDVTRSPHPRNTAVAAPRRARGEGCCGHSRSTLAWSERRARRASCRLPRPLRRASHPC